MTQAIATGHREGGTAEHETTSSLIGNALRRLLERQDAGAYRSFGNCIHFCLGAALARLEARVAVETFGARLPGLRLAPGQELRFVPNVAFRGPLALEAEWDA